MTKQTMISRTLIAVCAFNVFSASGQTSVENCVMELFKNGDKNLTLAEIRQSCQLLELTENSLEPKGNRPEPKGNRPEPEVSSPEPEVSSPEPEVSSPEPQVGLLSKPTFSLGVISERVMQEKQIESLPYVLSPHKPNYFQPFVTTDKINREAYGHMLGFEENLKDFEFKFQISLKVPLNEGSWLIENDGLYMGFTLQAWWQIYAGKISKPFRETNYQPEVFYIAPLPFHPFGGNTGFVVGVEHQSNGRGLELSRSWNRFYSHFLFEKDNFALSFKPWLRWQEDLKQYPLDPSGDDNPDIDDYLGHFELDMVYKWDEDYELAFMGRQNFSTNNGAAEFKLTFPLKFLLGDETKIKGYASAFTGYGDSLIDYNHYQTRFGLGLAFSNVL